MLFLPPVYIYMIKINGGTKPAHSWERHKHKPTDTYAAPACRRAHPLLGRTLHSVTGGLWDSAPSGAHPSLGAEESDLLSAPLVKLAVGVAARACLLDQEAQSPLQGDALRRLRLIHLGCKRRIATRPMLNPARAPMATGRYAAPPPAPESPPAA